MKINRVYRHYMDWEEIDTNMWVSVDGKEKWLAKAIEFTGDHKKYGRFMMRVIHDWPNSCENWLTDISVNRKAWIGHAACAMAINCPEDITRKAWGYLNDKQRELANREADRAIREWEYNYRKSIGVCEGLGEKML